eukprot:CAMPEP_0184699814 /NCGR_PEP_ID=MMETSP0313-20130426/5933_1 /TAXON_ID=2792 /ORGANISM="Porphyridium aerugineum, Strain SAG 1380-2" /LENGTH=479 /DNA_ID=CAMNT_0027158943 /DNA_START=221 /DNA_END=1660 /DNA_ORIENTATION=-
MDVRAGKVSIWLLIAIAFLCGFVSHALLVSPKGEYGKDAMMWELGGLRSEFGSGMTATTAKAVSAGEQSESRQFLPPAKFLKSDSAPVSSSVSNQDKDVTAMEQTILSASAEGPSDLHGRAALSQIKKSSMELVVAKSNADSAEPEYVGPYKEAGNRAARKEECRRWQSNFDERETFDNLLTPGKPATAQHSQDLVMFKTLLNPKVLGRSTGFYIDLAANLPRSLSNTYFLDVCRGWKGLCIEAQPDLVAKLRDYQRWGRTCTIIDTCVADRPGVEVDFVLSGGIGGIDGVRSKVQDTEWIERMKNIGHEHLLTENKMRTVKMACTTLESELRKVPADTFPGGTMPDGRKVVDFMSLDIEGAELMAIKGANFDEVFIRYILLELAPVYKDGTSERIPYSQQPFHDALELLKAKGFSVLMRLNLDVLLIHKDAIPDISMMKVRTTCNRNHVSMCMMCEDALDEDMCVGLKPNRRALSGPH